MSFADGIFSKTFSSHPYLFLFIVIVTGGILTHSYDVFAQKEEVEKGLSVYSKSVDDKFVAIENKFVALETKMDENSLAYLNLFSRQAMMNYSSEIHTLTELDRAGKANQRDRKRLRELIQDLENEQNSMMKRGVDGDGRSF